MPRPTGPLKAYEHLIYRMVTCDYMNREEASEKVRKFKSSMIMHDRAVTRKAIKDFKKRTSVEK